MRFEKKENTKENPIEHTSIVSVTASNGETSEIDLESKKFQARFCSFSLVQIKIKMSGRGLGQVENWKARGHPVILIKE